MNGRLSQSFTNEENGGIRRSVVCVAGWISSVQLLSHVQLFVTPWTAACQASPSIANSFCSNSCPLSWWCHSAISSSVIPFSSFNLSQIRVFSNESVLRIRWPKYWSFSFSISPSNEYSGLISFRVWSLCSPRDSQESSPTPQFKSINSSAFFIVQLSHPYMTFSKTIVLTRWTFVSKVMSLLFNMLSSLIITFLPRSKYFLISWLQSPPAVILEPLQN